MEPTDVSKKHFYISMIKSGVRIGGCIVAIQLGSVVWLASAFLAAEILGIVEEL